MLSSFNAHESNLTKCSSVVESNNKYTNRYSENAKNAKNRQSNNEHQQTDINGFVSVESQFEFIASCVAHENKLLLDLRVARYVYVPITVNSNVSVLAVATVMTKQRWHEFPFVHTNRKCVDSTAIKYRNP